MSPDGYPIFWMVIMLHQKINPSSSQPVASSSSTVLDALRQLSPGVSRKTIPRILEAYFSIKTLGDDGRVEANCKTCNKVIKGNITSTSNFRSHLQVCVCVFARACETETR